MDRTERIAEQHLLSRQLGKVEFEPDGNVPPDFLVGGRIAVEVRRLNQHVTTPNGPQALEAAWYPLERLIKRVLSSLGPAKNGESWFVMYDFKRPLPSWPTVEQGVRSALAGFQSQPLREATTLKVLPQLELRMVRAGPGHANFFLHGATIDGDSGGWLLSEWNSNIRRCMSEKEQKIAGVRQRYGTWWLLLVDFVGYGIEKEDEPDLRALLPRAHNWDKVLVVNPQDPSRAFEF